MKLLARFTLIALMSLAGSAGLSAQGGLPPDCAAVLEALGRQGDFKDNVYRVNFPRRDLAVRIKDRPAPTPAVPTVRASAAESTFTGSTDDPMASMSWPFTTT
jgi:hypothetical protein